MAASLKGERWTREQLKLAFYLYCQLPFGRLHQHNPEITELATLIGRTPSALAMKLTNFASLDPAITSTGRVGLKGASGLDRAVWDEFHENWERLAAECEKRLQQLRAGSAVLKESDVDIDDDFDVSDFSGETRRVLMEQRTKQGFFRRAVLTSYRDRCCMSGLSDPRLLVASHIVPWSMDRKNRLNPRNGLCLSALHDRAFDRGLITLSDELRVVLSRQVRERDDDFVRRVFLPIENRTIEVPERFAPDVSLVRYHRDHVFVGD